MVYLGGGGGRGGGGGGQHNIPNAVTDTTSISAQTCLSALRDPKSIQRSVCAECEKAIRCVMFTLHRL